jgi:5-methylcytosine-specific restriction endonuclease McrA
MKCIKCDKIINDGAPHCVLGGGQHICPECAFVVHYITEKEYLKLACYWNCLAKRAAINPKTGQVETTDKKFEWEKTNRDYRHSPAYLEWRTAVFERDYYTCLDCGQVGGKLEAHHIKTFREHPALRFVVNNGITLCRKCHRSKHAKRVNK